MMIKANRKRIDLGLMALEPRWMFDGAAAVDAAHAAPDAVAKALIPAAPAPVQIRAADPTQDGGKKEVVFVDTSVAGYQTLEAAVKPGIEIEEIDGSKGGLAQIAKWAETHTGYDSISLLSHGAGAAVQIGTNTLIDQLLSNATVQAELAQIGHALNVGGDLLLYGCDVAKGADGQQFITDLAAATGADVAASTDTTGKDGNWALERASGDIRATMIDGGNWDGDLGWTAVGSLSTSNDAYSESLAIASDGTIYLAYQDSGDTGKAVVKKYDGTSWTTVGTAGFSAGQTNDLRLAIAPDGTLYVAYNDRAAGFKETVMKYDGTSWTTVGSAGFSAGNTKYTSLAIASDGTVYVAYQDYGTSRKATVMKYNGTSWTTVGTAGFSAGYAYNDSLAIASDGTLYLAYSDGGHGYKATVMKYDGTSWSAVGSAGFTSDSVSDVSLAIASDGALNLSFADAANSDKATVMKYTGGAWSTVGAAGFSADTAYSGILTIASDGTPYLAYADGANSSKATVMKYTGGAWSVVGTAGATSGSADYLSLAIASDGTPYLAYRDFDNGGPAAVLSFTSGPANVAPTYVTGTAQSLSLSLNSAAVDLQSYLHVSDADASQTETWSQSVAPSHGTLSFSSATASSGSADITPGGTITYTPTTGYSGADTFSIQVADGQGGTATRVFNVTVAANVAPTYVTGTAQSLSLPFNSAATDLKPYLHANDADTGQTETWSQSVAPSHGSLSFSSATASSGSTDITPGGTITYTPTADYSGTDTFTIQVGDGTASVTRVFNVTVAAKPATVTPPPPAPSPPPPAPPPVVVAPPAPPPVVEAPKPSAPQVFAPLPPITPVAAPPVADAPKTVAPVVPVVVAPPVIQVVMTQQFTPSTADGAFRVPVVTATQGGPPVDGLVALRPEIQTPTITDGPLRIALPLDAFAHTRSDAVVTLNALRVNGQPLPQWLNFDSRSGTLTGQPPGDFKGTMVVKIIARDDKGQEATITVRINGQPEKTGAVETGKIIKLGQHLRDKPGGKVAFTQQLKLAARFAAIRFS